MALGVGMRVFVVRPVVALRRRSTSSSSSSTLSSARSRPTSGMSTSFAAARGVARAAATSCPRRARRAVARSSSRRASARVAASATSSSSSGVEVITFDLDDTLWPTTPVVAHANQAFVDFCSERIPGFPDTAGVNEYMKARRRARGTPRGTSRTRHPPFVRPPPNLGTSSPLPPPPPSRPPRPRRESARSARRSRGETTTATSRCRSRRFASRPRTWRRSSSVSPCTTRCRS